MQVYTYSSLLNEQINSGFPKAAAARRIAGQLPRKNAPPRRIGRQHSAAADMTKRAPSAAGARGRRSPRPVTHSTWRRASDVWMRAAPTRRSAPIHHAELPHGRGSVVAAGLARVSIPISPPGFLAPTGPVMPRWAGPRGSCELFSFYGGWPGSDDSAMCIASLARGENRRKGSIPEARCNRVVDSNFIDGS